MTSTRVFNMESKQLIKIFSRIFSTDADEMTDHLNNNGEVSQTIRHYYSRSNSSFKPKDNSTLTLKEVDTFLDKLTEITKEQDQVNIFVFLK
jgi:DNA ligase-3